MEVYPPETSDRNSQPAPSASSALSLESQKLLELQTGLSRQMRAHDSRSANALDLVGEALYSSAFMGIQSPLLGGAQIVDQYRKTDLAGRLNFMPAPEQAEFGSGRWHAQQVGGALGMMLPVMLTSRVMKATGVSFVARGEAAALSSGKLAAVSKTAMIADGAATGFAYDFLMHPVAPEQGDFWQARAKNGLTGLATFGALTAGSVGLRQLTRPMAESLSTGLRKGAYDVALGVGAGAPAGSINADASALLHEGRLATNEERLKSAYTFSVVGGALSLAHKIPGQDTTLADRALSASENKSGLRNLSQMLAERNKAQLAGSLEPAQSSPLIDRMVGGLRSVGSQAKNLIEDPSTPLRRGRAMASSDIEGDVRQVKTSVAPEMQATLQKGVNIGFEASDASAPTAKTLEFFQFARGEGAQLKHAMLEVAEQSGDVRFLTIVQEAYLAQSPVRQRMIMGEMSIRPDPGVEVTESQLQRWSQFLQHIEKPPTDAEGYANYRMTLFDWLNNNPDLHNWVRQYGEQTDLSSRSGPIDFYFETQNMGRFVKVSDGKGAVEKPISVGEIETVRRVSKEFADQVSTEPYDARMVENFVARVTEAKGGDLHMLAHHMNEALRRERIETTAAVGTETDSQITLFRPTTTKKSESVGRVDYDFDGRVLREEGVGLDEAKANELANKFARSLSTARTTEEAQFLLADVSADFREAGVFASEVPGQVNWVFKNNKMPYELTVSDQGVLNLSYVQEQSGHKPLVSVRVLPDGQVVSKTYE